MHTRYCFLTLLACLLICSEVSAHRLLVKAEVLAGRHILITSWFDLSGGYPINGRYRATQQKQPIDEGLLDSKGQGTFTYRALAPIVVVITDGTGHRAELVIPMKRLRQGYVESLAQAIGLCLAPDLGALTRSLLVQEIAPVIAHEPGTDVVTSQPGTTESSGTMINILVGLGFLLALAAFFIGLRNAREIERLKKLTPGSPDSTTGDTK